MKKNNLSDLEQKIIELTEALQRERADAMNLRRRADEEKAALGSFYKASVVRELLPVIDNFERALKHIPAESREHRAEGRVDQKLHEWVNGVGKIVKQFEDVLEKMGVKKIETVGKAFDPRLHEAVSTEEGDGEEVITEELQSGYTLGDEVLRHAMVKVKS